MVQTYGVASDHNGSIPPEAHSAAEGDALLGAEATPRKPKSEGHATLQSCVGNLANTIIGSGEFSTCVVCTVSCADLVGSSSSMRNRHVDLPTGVYLGQRSSQRS